MNKTTLIETLSRQTGLDRHMLEVVLGNTFRTIEAALARGEPVAISGFGTFSVKQRAARRGRNPRTGEPIAIPASRGIAFKAARAWREKMLC